MTAVHHFLTSAHNQAGGASKNLVQETPKSSFPNHVVRRNLMKNFLFCDENRGSLHEKVSSSESTSQQVNESFDKTIADQPQNDSANVVFVQSDQIQMEILEVPHPGFESRPGISSQSDPENIIYGFNLDDVLNSDAGVRTVIQHKVRAEKFILRADRQIVANVLVDALISNLGTCPSKLAMVQLAKHLVKRYPAFGNPMRKEGGWEMWFFHSSFGPGPTGFLEDRLKNQRKRLAKRKEKPSLTDVELETYALSWESENESEDLELDDKVEQYLKHNFGNPTIPSMMMDSVFSRRTIIRNSILQKMSGLEKIAERMPRLFDMQGMIIQDFDVRHPNLALIIYTRWPKASKLLFQYAEESGINYMKKFGVQKSRYDLTDDDYLLLAFCLMPYILPSCARKINDVTVSDEEDNNDVEEKPRPKKRKLSTVKASDLDALKSLITFRSPNTNVIDVLNENKQPAPFILGLGKTYDLTLDTFFVIIHKFAVPCGPNFMIAFDTWFKCFKVLSLPEPVESMNIWLFLQHCIGGRPFEKNLLPPVVQALIGQIMPRLLG